MRVDNDQVNEERIPVQVSVCWRYQVVKSAMGKAQKVRPEDEKKAEIHFACSCDLVGEVGPTWQVGTPNAIGRLLHSYPLPGIVEQDTQARELGMQR